MVVSTAMTLVLGPQNPDDPPRKPWFPGSQPVSLERSNLELLRQRR
jgi:hypothetical protein